VSWVDELDADTIQQFDANNVSRLFAQDWLVIRSGVWPILPIVYTERIYDSPSLVRHAAPAIDPELSDYEFGLLLTGLQNAVLLPLCPEFNTTLRGLLALCRADVARRLREAKKRERNLCLYGESGWQNADFRAEVEAVCGPGHKAGREFFFSCPFHTDSDPSLHVDPETKRWHCFGCQRGGGVLDWRKETGGDERSGMERRGGGR